MLAARKTAPPEIAFKPGPEGEAARKQYGDWYTETMRREWYSIGIHLGFDYYHSPVICPDGSPAPPDEVSHYKQTGRPGHRAPHVWLQDGRSILDLFGRFYVLLCFAAGGADRENFSKAAVKRNVPLVVVSLEGESAARALYGADYVLVRPDGHVAWRGDALPDDAGRVIDIVRGAAMSGAPSVTKAISAAHDEAATAVTGGAR
jgi:hypothetical protein